MKCSLCGREFDEKAAEVKCKACLMGKFCKMVCCPRCGSTMPKPRKKKVDELGANADKRAA